MNTNSITGSLARPLGTTARVARVNLGRRQLDALCVLLLGLWLLAGLLLVYRAPARLRLEIGGSYARAYLRGFDQPERNETYNYAFAGPQAQIFLPGAGGGLWDSALRFNGVRPAGVEPARITMTAAGSTLTWAPIPDMRTYHLLTPATRGDLDLRFTTNAFRAGATDQRLLGFPLDTFEASAVMAGAPLRAGLLLLAIGLGLYALGRRLACTPAQALILALLAVSLALLGIAASRLFLTVGLVRWLVVLLGLHVALAPLQVVARVLYRRAGAALSAREEVWLWRIFAAALLVKLGGMLYPHAIIFDQAAHVLRMNWLLQGRFMELYRPGYTSYMGDTVGLAAGQFPYSPLWYLVVTPFHFLGLGLPDATNGLSAIMDVSKLFPIHLIARLTLRSRRTALLAAALYNIIPMPYFLLSWGNYPTQFGLWASLLATAYLVVAYRRVASRRAFAVWVGLMVLAILSYTVLGVFSISLMLLVGGLGLLQRDGLGLRRLRFVVLGILAAELLCFAVYHVQFARSILTETLPAVLAGTTDRVDNPLEAAADPRANAWANFAANNQFTLNHFTSLALAVSAVGAYLLLRHRLWRDWWPLWVGWAALFVLYSLVSAYVADMVLKHIFIVMPLVCILMALALDRWWRAGRWGRAAAVAVMLFIAADTVVKGYGYLLVKRHF